VSFGVCRGRILAAPRGEGGFGYDPIFAAGDDARSLAELTRREKNAISHRARALHALAPVLESPLQSEPGHPAGRSIRQT
jgi:XTP/dITP diphosphohydrolase